MFPGGAGGPVHPPDKNADSPVDIEDDGAVVCLVDNMVVENLHGVDRVSKAPESTPGERATGKTRLVVQRARSSLADEQCQCIYSQL